MNEKGIIISVNQAFTASFGYKNEEVAGKSCDIFFIAEDRSKSKPSIEIETVLTNGVAQDINFLLHKNGNPIWVAGESILTVENGERFIIKLIHNIHTQKVLEHLLTDANELVDKIFDIPNNTPLILFDSELRIIKANTAFCNLFSIECTDLPGKKINETDSKFLSDKAISAALRSVAIKDESVEEKQFSFVDGGGITVQLCLSAKNIFDRSDADRKTLLIVKVMR